MATVDKKEAAELVRLNGKRIDLKEVEASLMGKLPLRQCAVVASKQVDGASYLRAFVVMDEPQGLNSVLMNYELPEPVGSLPIIPLPSLPRTEDGTVDKRQLALYEYSLPQQAEVWENGLLAVEGIEEAAVIIREQIEPVKTYHILDLLPADLADTSDVNRDENQMEHSHASLDTTSGDSQVPWALAYGGDLEERSDWPCTLPEALRRSVLESPDKGILYVRDGQPDELQTYPVLLADAERILGGMRAAGLQPHDVVILQFADNRKFISALWACFLGGIIPTPIAVAPVYSEMNGAVRKLQSSWELLEHPAILTDQDTEPALRNLSQLWNTSELWILTSESLGNHDRDSDWYESSPEDPVLNLLSSGSTGMPKCIQHRHRSLLARMKATAVFNDFSKEEVSLNWMPLDHVGGVVMFHIRDVFLGCQQIKPHIDSFIANPLIWLDWADKYKATLTWAPNFAFALVNERGREIGEGQWDLSSLRYIMNAGEAVVARVAQRFLRLLQPHGLSDTAMVPAYGMSETSSAVTQNKSFRSEGTQGIRIVDKTTLSGGLKEVDDSHPNKIAFTEVGGPIPTVSIRIADNLNHVLRENQIGRLQVKGPTIMDGYYRNPEANEEAFVGEGWFNTGDLAFLHQGVLCITGREKDVIIINGANYHNYEIEAVVEEIPGVEVTFSAAYGIFDPESGSDRLAIFFVSSEGSLEEQMPVVQAIRQTIVRRIGIQPQVILPVGKSVFPKTNSGKIQRAELGKRYLSGEFAEVSKKMDIWLENDRTLPAWFFEPVWRVEKKGPAAASFLEEGVLIFADEQGLSTALCERLTREGRKPIQIQKGQKFARTAADTFTINPANSIHYSTLLKIIRQEGIAVRDILHAWTYDGHTVQNEQSLEDREEAQRTGILSLLHVIQAVYGEEADSCRLTLVTSQAGRVKEHDVPNPDKAALTGLLKTLQAEHGNSRVLYIDLELDDPDVNAGRVYQEMHLSLPPEQVAYRNGERLVPWLLAVDPLRETVVEQPLEQGGAYLITGGLGGIGWEVARFLLVHYQARLLLIGRSSLDSDAASQTKARKLSELATLGEVLYRQADVCSQEEVRQVVIEAEEQWQISLSGAFHLAGVGNVEEHLLASERYTLQGETEESFLSQLEAKVLGTRSLFTVFADHPEARLVFFSSVNSYFGGAAFGAYSAANAYMDAFVQSMRIAGRSAIVMDWSMWHNIGMSEQTSAEASVQKGFHVISKSRGIHSLLLAMRMNLPQLLIGLDGANRWIRPQVVQERLPRWTAAAYYTGNPSEKALSAFRESGTDSSFEGSLTHLESMPYTAFGEIDRGRLPLFDQQANRLEPVYRVLSTEWEHSLALIWQEVLECETVSAADNFFDLGGHSLKATKVISRINHQMGMKVPLQILFQHSTLGELAAALEEMSPMNHVSSPSADYGIPQLAKQEYYELSHAQRRVWFLCQMVSQQAVYNILGRWEIRGPLLVDYLQEAFQILVERHQTLRSTFVNMGGKPLQRVHERLEIPISVVDLSFLAVASRTRHLEETVDAEAARHYDLEQGPLMAVTLVKLGEEHYELLIAQHHLISDGWSLNLLINELGYCYETLANQLQPYLLPLPVEWTDFAAWHNHREDTNETEQNYWLNHLAGELPCLNLPADHPRKAVQTYDGDTEQLFLRTDVLQRMTRINQQSGTTMHMLMLAAVNCMLYKLTGQTDLIVGTPVAGRDHPASEPLVGMFVNTLALRTRIEGDPTFQELLEQVKQTALNGQAHQHYPFDKLVEELGTPRDLSRPPVFQVMLGYMSLPLELTLGNLEIQEKMVQHRVAKFDLSLHVFERGDTTQILFEYNTDLFDKSTVVRWMGHLQTLLEHISVAPSARLSKLSLMTDEELHQVVYSFNRTETDFPREAVIHELFAEQVERTPNAVAVVFDGQTLTYAELDRRTTVLAGQLQSRGVGPDVPVAALFERSFEMIIGILGIIKAGGAYVPIDPEYPQARIAYILEVVESPLLLTHNRLQELAGDYSLPVLFADAPWTEPTCTYNSGLAIRNSNQLAYINFTSGSTGKPKGVMIPHVGVVRLVKNTKYADLGPNDRMLQIVNYAFDVFSYEIWGALLNGGSLVIVPREAILDMSLFSRAMVEHGITTGFVPTALFNRLVESYPESLSGARALLVGGEALSVAHTRKALEYLPKGLLNGYGPTENTTYACVHQITSLPEDALSVPIGPPLSNSTAIIRDGYGNPVPIGVTGEIYMGGMGVALGYFKDPERTQECFIPNPYHGLPGEKLYKSGDLGRWLPDGTIEYLGRIDNQVKIRGYRIECGEIETTMLNFPGIKQCVVVPRADANGHKRLIGYVVAATADPLQWTVFLQKTLPYYMIPAAFVLMERLPLNSNGKIDKAALPEPVIQGENDIPFTEPRNEREEKIAAVWREVLGRERISIHDSFFDLGGDSLLSIQVVSRLNQQGIKADPKLVFQYPTIAELAERLATLPEQESGKVLTPQDYLIELRAGSPEGSRLFFAPPAGGTVMGYFELSRKLHGIGTIYALQSPGLYEGEEPRFLSYEQLVLTFLSSIEDSFRPHLDYLAGHSMGGHIAFGMCQELVRRGTPPKGLIILDTTPALTNEDSIQVEMSEEELKLLVLVLGMGNLVGVPQERLKGLDYESAKAIILEEGRKDEAVRQFMSDGYLDKYLKLQMHNLIMSRILKLHPMPVPVPLYVYKTGEHPPEYEAMFQDWHRYTTSEVAIIPMSGNHVTMMRDPHVQNLAEHMKKVLQGAVTTGTKERVNR
ncbi:amino acid adenylation domain-containing protein [Paenibacillus sp. LC-T2]|uniref:Amino acid adenylation domain-containing protein n=1 Tax=Paenibacillus monticola TaxID=2666075 RepID=A0A7X2H9N6_9BACL|nr:amino acid adenylation domain-containing protein [Paenibacillus monticola]